MKTLAATLSFVFLAMPASARADEPTQMHSVGLFAGGIVMVAAGLASAVAGTVMMASNAAGAVLPEACGKGGIVIGDLGSSCGYGTATRGFSTAQIGGVFLTLGGGGLLFFGGIGMTISGGWQVPITSPTRAQQAAGVPAVTVGPQKATLTWTF